MVKEIVKDVLFLGRKSTEATKEDMSIIQDLKDTLAFHRGRCLGMAANMIGYNKKIIIIAADIMDLVMVNPVIIEKEGQYEATEGCLSLTGQRKAKRYSKIRVKYQNERFKWKEAVFEGLYAQIIQHEMDHLEGIII